jgi:YebC/PmpR family DNA-binding regulatory protein
MAGHSKWKNIQHRKGAQDAKRGQIFTRLIREITIAARQNPDVNINPRLRAAVDKALDNNMSKDTIQKAINKGAGLDEAAQLLEVTYEGYGPGGVAFIVECATDNKNRTVPEIRQRLVEV